MQRAEEDCEDGGGEGGEHARGDEVVAAAEGGEDLEEGDAGEVVGPEDGGGLPAVAEGVVGREAADCVVDYVDD